MAKRIREEYVLRADVCANIKQHILDKLPEEAKKRIRRYYANSRTQACPTEIALSAMFDINAEYEGKCFSFDTLDRISAVFGLSKHLLRKKTNYYYPAVPEHNTELEWVEEKIDQEAIHTTAHSEVYDTKKDEGTSNLVSFTEKMLRITAELTTMNTKEIGAAFILLAKYGGISATSRKTVL